MKEPKPPPQIISVFKQERFKTEPFPFVQLSKYLESLWRDHFINIPGYLL